ncbi:golvesin C-terminal-like domain-containing protein [Micromonospora auratinigra]|uniref:N-acetylmuramoyl-L-alanine amidase n=1 Tax=Micromonospora auratinigra TaxID=261654 RepID=A0A1A8Z9G7_9ACTN|nr:N-acetylmuramoyl-L-alanine amidase [Micromonospora auratinigra]SBT40510.1 N-acetylmuramoyl-L-alanine amidase [Micromonospora auratinigra]
MTGSPPTRRDVLRGAVLLGISTAAGGFSLTLPEAALAAAAPSIAGCATWGARNPSSALTTLSANPDKILIHHTDTANSTDYSQAHAFALSRSIQDYHMDSNGWADTGQHFTNSRGGYVTEGRHGSLARLQAGSGIVVGAHCPGQNDKAIGIENEGNYNTVAPPAALYSRLVELCAYICDQYAIPATQIFGHRDFYSTDCPGDVLYAKLPQLRTDVAAALGGPPAFSVIVDNATAGFTASANWSTSASTAGRYGADYRYASPQAVSDAAYFSATIPADGSYRIEVWHPASSAYNAATPHVVLAATGSQTVTLDQRTGGGAWRSLGTFALTAGTRNVVAVSRWSTTGGYVVADAVRITRS